MKPNQIAAVVLLFLLVGSIPTVAFRFPNWAYEHQLLLVWMGLGVFGFTVWLFCK